MLRKFIILTVIVFLVLYNYKSILHKIEKHLEKNQEQEWAVRWQYHIGNFYFYTTQFNQAMEIFNKILSTKKTNSYQDDALYMIGRCAEEMYDRRKARESYNKLIEDFPESELVAAAKDKLRFLEMY